MSVHPSRQLPRLPLPVAGWPLYVLIALFLLAGTIGHDPWKNEDATHFGVVWRAVAADDWLAFRFVSGQVVEPPLYYWVGAALGSLLSPLIAWPDAVRLASPLFAAVACALLHLAARELYGAEAAGGAPLALAGSLGLLVQSHETQPMLATLAAISAVYAGTALGSRRPWSAAVLLGAGSAGVVLSHGVTLLPAVLAGLCAAIVRAPERVPQTGSTLLGLLLGAGLCAPWLLQLQSVSPPALAAWWSAELAQFGRVDNPADNALHYGTLLAWFAWPALPLALWGLWERRRRLAEPAQFVPLVTGTLMLFNLIVAFPARFVVALALLPALALLAVPGALALRRGAANALDWFGRMTLGLIAGVLWLGWVAMNFGVPARMARNFAKLAPGFVAAVDPLAVGIAAVMSMLWLWLIFGRAPSIARQPLQPLANWLGGMALIWILATTLLLPWIEYARTYRSVAAGIEPRVGPASGCIATRNIGEPQFASLDYFLDHRLRPERGGKTNCRWLVTLGTGNEPIIDGEWRKVWEGTRPGDKNERFRLYRRL